MSKPFYESPLEGRYASEAMRRVFSPDHRYGTWRRLWLALAEAEHELGLPVTEAQLAQLRVHLDDIDYDAVHAYEVKVRHDVMAHVLALGDLCPEARPIIHLGATSCYVTDNADLLLLREALGLIRAKVCEALRALEEGVIPGEDMTSECAATKLMWALGQGMDTVQIAAFFQTSVAGEVTIR